jgi:hypothetical protein
VLYTAELTASNRGLTHLLGKKCATDHEPKDHSKLKSYKPRGYEATVAHTKNSLMTINSTQNQIVYV